MKRAVFSKIKKIICIINQTTLYIFSLETSAYPSPLYTMSAEHSFFEKLKRKTVKALECVFFLTQMYGHLFILIKDYSDTALSSIWLFQQRCFFFFFFFK